MHFAGGVRPVEHCDALVSVGQGVGKEDQRRDAQAASMSRECDRACDSGNVKPLPRGLMTSSDRLPHIGQ